MASFANFSANLKLNIQDFSSKLRTASNDMRKFARTLNGQTVSGMEELNKQTTRWGLNMKSVSRVVSGILISQAFYTMVRNIREAANAVWDFTKQLETAKVAYSNLFGDTALAIEFINVLKDFAAKTPFSFKESEAAAKRLLAYGIEYKNVMYVMQGVLSAASIQGDSAKIESISRALGQIHTYGKLMTQEVRQLSEAGIPAYEILREELGLTQEQLKDLGNEGIPASLAINALVDGIQKRFGSAAIAASKTLSGIISNIKDNATMLFAGLFEPFSVFIKSGLNELGQFLYAMRELYELKGAGGVFEAIFPPEMHDTIRLFIARIGELFQSIIRLVVAVSGLLRPAFEALMTVVNALAPIFTMVINALAALVQMITNNATAMRVLTGALAAAAAMWVVYKVQALATTIVTGVITAMSKAIMLLHTALNWVVAHPFWALMIGIGAVLAGVAIGFGGISDKVKELFNSLTAFSTIDPDKILLPSQKERANDLDKFNKRLEGTSDAMDDLADSTGNATKAAKGLLGFDEVFKLPEKDTDSGWSDDIADLIEGIEGIGDAYIPEIPDFSEYTSALTNSFLDQLKEAWNGIGDTIASIAGIAIWAGFGKLLGTLLGGKVGGVLGAIAGAIVGYFWNMLADYFELTPEQKLDAGIVGGVGALIGAALGGIVGGPLGAKIGALIGGFVGSFWGIFAEALGVIPEQHIATLTSGLVGFFSMFFKDFFVKVLPMLLDDSVAAFARTVGFSIKDGLIGALKQGAIGAVVGLATGILSNALTAWIAGELELTEQDLKNAGTGQTIGSIIGTITGMILGGPAGSLIGGALGQLAGSVLGEFWSYMNNTLKGTLIGGAAGLPTGALIGTLVGSIGGPLGAALGAAIGAALGLIVGLIVDYWEPIKGFFIDAGNAIADAVMWVVTGLGNIGTAIGDFFSNVGSIGTFFSDAFNSIKTVMIDFGTSVGETLTAVGDFFSEKFSGIITLMSDLWLAITTVWNDISLAVTTVVTDMWNAITTVWNDISLAVTTVCQAVWGVISEIWYLIRDLVVKVVTDIWNGVVQFFTPIANEISRVCSIIWSSITQAFTGMLNDIKTALNSIWSFVSSIFTTVLNFIKTFAVNFWTELSNVFRNVLNFIKTTVNDVWRTVSNAFSSVYTSVSSAVSNMYSSVRDAFSNIYSSVTNSISNMYTSIKQGIANIYETFRNWIANLWDQVFGKFFGWITDGIDKLREFFGLESRANESRSYSSSSTDFAGHASGGVFNREHYARFAEGNKAEAIIPLEEDTAMQPFVDAVANGLTASLAPILASLNGGVQQQSLQPLYVGTLIADERGLKELERKMEIIRMQESRR